MLTGGLDVRISYGGLIVSAFGNAGSRKSANAALNVEREIPQSVAFSLASETACWDMSIPVATMLPFGQRWQSRIGIQPEPVPRSSRERVREVGPAKCSAKRLLVLGRYSASAAVHQCVSGLEGMSFFPSLLIFPTVPRDEDRCAA